MKTNLNTKIKEPTFTNKDIVKMCADALADMQKRIEVIRKSLGNVDMEHLASDARRLESEIIKLTHNVDFVNEHIEDSEEI